MKTTFHVQPDRIIIGLSTIAWLWMLGEAAAARRLACCGPHPSAAEDMVAWLGMVVSMMMPTTIPAVRDIAARSYRVRRLRAVSGYLLGYMACWLTLGVAFVALRQFTVAHASRSDTVLCLIGAVWALLPTRRLWFLQCHRQIPLCPVGFRADLDAFRQGTVNGVFCVAMCWPLMIACALSGHSLALMVGGMALVVFEKRMFRLKRWPLVLGALLLAACTLMRE
jgi:predicted metal-binding membrane protein